MCDHHQNQDHRIIPCLHCHPQSYIRMVQHLIERCLLFHMSRDQCVKALAKHASIRPLVTLTVWRELQKENRDFFRAYSQSLSLPIAGDLNGNPPERWQRSSPTLRAKRWN